MSKDLWPDFEAEKIKNPKTVLVEQANLLGEKTKNVIIAEVRTAGDSSKNIIHSFDIVAPAMGNYRFNLFQIRHSILFYPLDFLYKNTGTHVKTEEELIDRMAYVFNNDETKNILNSLYSQSI